MQITGGMSIKANDRSRSQEIWRSRVELEGFEINLTFASKFLPESSSHARFSCAYVPPLVRYDPF